MSRWRICIPGLLLAALVACGGATTTSNQTLAEPTATAAPRSSAAPSVGADPPVAPSAAPALSATASVPSALPAAPASSAPPTAPRPLGQAPALPPAPTTVAAIPAGWRVYRGPAEFPIAVAYPPGWTVDDSLFPEQSVIFIYGPDRQDDEMVEIVGGSQQADANIDVLRDEFFYKKTEFCEKTGIEGTEQRRVANAQFAILRATCDSSNTLTFLQVASGLKGGDEWSIAMRTPYARKGAIVRTVFDPMLASLDIYARIPR